MLSTNADRQMEWRIAGRLADIRGGLECPTRPHPHPTDVRIPDNPVFEAIVVCFFLPF
jgi:hypothetical protein